VEEKPIEIPGSRWEWLLADKRRLAALIVGTLVLLGVVAALAVGMLAGDSPTEGDEPVAIDPVPPTGSVDTTNGAEGSADETPGVDGAPGGVPGAGGENGSGSAGGGSQPVVPGRAPYIAYRYGGQVWVSREDGSAAVMVADSPQGTFSLSPDGTALALVDGGLLSIITVSDRARAELGVAEPGALAWEADSSAVLCVRATEDGQGVTEVWRVPRRVGATPIKLVQGGSPSVAIDGTVAALPVTSVTLDPTKGTVWVLPSGRSPQQVATSGYPAACAVQAGTVAYAVTGMRYTDATGAEKQIDPEIWVMNTDGSSGRRIVGKPATQRPFGYANLMLSPDGQRLLYAEVGDDGYSRAWIVPATGGAPVGLSVRRDTYPLGWSADGTSVFLIEGNAFQGEPTALVTARSDGLGRRTVIEGAGL
jgi:hypothetical protein